MRPKQRVGRLEDALALPMAQQQARDAKGYTELLLNGEPYSLLTWRFLTPEEREAAGAITVRNAGKEEWPAEERAEYDDIIARGQFEAMRYIINSAFRVCFDFEPITPDGIEMYQRLRASSTKQARDYPPLVEGAVSILRSCFSAGQEPEATTRH